jgi:hypothetical protein
MATLYLDTINFYVVSYALVSWRGFMDITHLSEIARTLPAAGAIFVITLVAFAVIWKALDVVARALRERGGGR